MVYVMSSRLRVVKTRRGATTTQTRQTKMAPAHTQPADTTAKATALTTPMATVYATSLKWRVARTQLPATTTQMLQTKTVLAHTQKKATTALVTA